MMVSSGSEYTLIAARDLDGRLVDRLAYPGRERERIEQPLVRGGQGDARAGSHFAHDRDRRGEISRQQHQHFGLIGLLRQPPFDLRRNVRQRLAGGRRRGRQTDGDAALAIDGLFGQGGGERRRRNPARIQLHTAEQRRGRGLPDGHSQEIACPIGSS